MSKRQLSKTEWVDLFREAGLDDATMKRWHEAFERRAPDAHQSFLEWLSIPPAEIDQIRQHSRTS